MGSIAYTILWIMAVGYYRYCAMPMYVYYGSSHGYYGTVGTTGYYGYYGTTNGYYVVPMGTM